MKHYILLLAVLLSFAPAVTIDFAPEAVGEAGLAVLADMNLPAESVAATRVTTARVETEPAVLAGYISDVIPLEQSGWTRMRIRVALDIRATEAGTEVAPKVELERFGVPWYLLSIPPAWTPAVSNGRLEAEITAAIVERLAPATGEER